MSHKNQLITGIIITAIIIGGAGFYGGMQYEKSSLSKQGMLRDRNNQFGNNGTGQDRQFAGMRKPGGGPGGTGPNGDFTTGEITGKDDKSITIKTRDGGSKIIFFSDSTTIGKAEQGSVADLNNGEQVVVNGKSNPDGSLSAQNIQIRPAGQNGQLTQ